MPPHFHPAPVVARRHRLRWCGILPQVKNVPPQGGLIVLYDEKIVPPWATIRWQTLLWVNWASPVTTRPARSNCSSSPGTASSPFLLSPTPLLSHHDTGLMGVGRHQVNSGQLFPVDSPLPLAV